MSYTYCYLCSTANRREVSRSTTHKWALSSILIQQQRVGHSGSAATVWKEEQRHIFHAVGSAEHCWLVASSLRFQGVQALKSLRVQNGLIQIRRVCRWCIRTTGWFGQPTHTDPYNTAVFPFSTQRFVFAGFSWCADIKTSVHMMLLPSRAVHTDDARTIGPHIRAHVAVNVSDCQMITLQCTQTTTEKNQRH